MNYTAKTIIKVLLKDFTKQTYAVPLKAVTIHIISLSYFQSRLASANNVWLSRTDSETQICGSRRHVFLNVSTIVQPLSFDYIMHIMRLTLPNWFMWSGLYRRGGQIQTQQLPSKVAETQHKHMETLHSVSICFSVRRDEKKDFLLFFSACSSNCIELHLT